MGFLKGAGYCERSHIIMYLNLSRREGFPRSTSVYLLFFLYFLFLFENLVFIRRLLFATMNRSITKDENSVPLRDE